MSFFGAASSLKEGEPRNQIGKYASKVMRSEFNRVNATLSLDVQQAIEGHCIYLPNLLSPKFEYSILQSLAHELEEGLETGMIAWSKHLKHEDPDFSATFKAVIKQLDVSTPPPRKHPTKANPSWIVHVL